MQSMKNFLGCSETVTVVRHVKTPDTDAYTCEVIVGVSWFSKRGATVSAGGEAPEVETVVRIPAEVCPEELPKKDDLIVRGALGAYESRKSLEGYESFRVALVGDNRRARLLPHVVVKSQ